MTRFLPLLAVIQLITLHMVDGREVQVNPRQVTQLQSGRPDGAAGRALVGGVNCVVRFTDGQYLSVVEDCNRVRELMEGEER